MLKEYVPSDELAHEINEWLKSNEGGYHELAERAGVSPRAVSKIIRGETRYQTIFMADALMVAMRRYIYHLPTVWRKPHAK